MPRKGCSYHEIVNDTDVSYFIIKKAPYVYCGDLFAAIGLFDPTGKYSSRCEQKLSPKRDYMFYKLHEGGQRRCYLTKLGVYNVLHTFIDGFDTGVNDVQYFYSLTRDTKEKRAVFHITDTLKFFEDNGKFPEPTEVSKQKVSNKLLDDSYGIDLLEEVLSVVHELDRRIDYLEKDLRIEVSAARVDSTSSAVSTLEAIMASPLTAKNKDLKRKVDKTLLSLRQSRDRAMQKIDNLVKECEQLAERENKERNS